MSFLLCLRIKGLFNTVKVPGESLYPIKHSQDMVSFSQSVLIYCLLVIFQFCVKMSPVEGICTGSSTTEHRGRKSSKCLPQKIEGSSSHWVTFTVLPLEIGLHNINFSLETSVGKEILVKTLRVVVRKTCFF